MNDKTIIKSVDKYFKECDSFLKDIKFTKV